MTIIQPNKHQKAVSFVPTNVLWLLLGLAAVCAVVLVMIYHNTAETMRAYEAAVKEIRIEQNRTANLQKDLLEAFNTDKIYEVVGREGFVVEKNPTYVKTQESWEVASRY